MYRIALLSLAALCAGGLCIVGLTVGGCGNIDLFFASSIGEITRIAPSPLQAGVYTGIVTCTDSSTINGAQSSSETESELSIAIGSGGIPVAGRTVLRPGRSQASQIFGIDIRETITRVVTDTTGVLVDGNVEVVSASTNAAASRDTGTESTLFLVNPTDPNAINYSFSLQLESHSGESDLTLDQQCSGTLFHEPGSEGDVVCDDCANSPECLTCEEYTEELMRLQRILSAANVCQVLDLSIASIECDCCEDSATAPCAQLLSDFQAQRLQARCP